MKISICSGMAFARDMMRIKILLEKLKRQLIIQKDIEKHAEMKIKNEDKWRKIKIDPFKSYCKEIKKSEAILVINKEKNNIKNCIGWNTLIETAFTHILNKKIFLLNPVLKISYSNEIEAIKPIVLN